MPLDLKAYVNGDQGDVFRGLAGRVVEDDGVDEVVVRLDDGVRRVIRGLGAFRALARSRRSRGDLGTPERRFLGGRALGGLAGVPFGRDVVLERGRGRGITRLGADVFDVRRLVPRLGFGSVLTRGRALGLALDPAAGLGRLGRRLCILCFCLFIFLYYEYL